MDGIGDRSHPNRRHHRLAIDAIVNAANSSLLGGGGVGGRHPPGGRAGTGVRMPHAQWLQDRDAKLTKGYRLPARYIIHTVGPVWQGGGKGEAELLASCYRRSLELAAANGLPHGSVSGDSRPHLSLSERRAAGIAARTVSTFLEQKTMPETVIFCCFDDHMAELYRQALLPAVRKLNCMDQRFTSIAAKNLHQRTGSEAKFRYCWSCLAQWDRVEMKLKYCRKSAASILADF